jgi:protein O-mannosyl-transferase
MPQSENAYRTGVVLLILVAGVVAYANTLDGGWVWDDASSVLLHKHVRDPGKVFELFREDQHRFGKGQGNFYRPLLSVTFMIDYALSGGPAPAGQSAEKPPEVEPLIFHITNLAWHLLAAILFFAILTRLGAPRFVRAAAALIYVLHPLHTEAVAYISGRADMMSAAFMFAALLCALRPGVPAALLSVIFFGGGLLSKESTSIFPFLLAVFILLRPLEAGEEAAGKKAAYTRRAVPLALCLAVFAVYGVLRMTVLHFGGGGGGEAGAAPGQRLVETFQAFAFYCRALFLPVNLHMEQRLAGAAAAQAVAGALLLLVCIGILILAWRAGRWRVALGLGWFLIAWLPISGIFPLNAPMAEHWMYVPMAGFWWAFFELVWSGTYSPAARRAGMAAVWAGCVFFTALTAARNQEWDSNVSLFRATLRENPDTLRVHYNLAVTYEDLENNLPAARRHYEEVLRLFAARKEPGGKKYLLDGEIEAHLSLGRILVRAGDFKDALAHYAPVAGLQYDTGTQEQQLDRRAWKSAALAGMGRCLLALGDIGNAQVMLRQAIQLEPRMRGEVESLLTDGPLIPG